MRKRSHHWVDNCVSIGNKSKESDSYLCRGGNSGCSRCRHAGSRWHGGSRGLRPRARHRLRGGGRVYGSLNWCAWSHFWSWGLCPFNPLLLTVDAVWTRNFRCTSYHCKLNTSIWHRVQNILHFIVMFETVVPRCWGSKWLCSRFHCCQSRTWDSSCLLSGWGLAWTRTHCGLLTGLFSL